MNAPIALFTYDRPQHTRQTIEALLRNPAAASSDLHVFSDGPKTDAAEQRVRDVRAYLRTVDGFASVSLTERDRNAGLAVSVIEGVTRLSEEFGSVIVVEDDLQVAPGFLQYLNAALERYGDDPPVMQISGHMFPVELKIEEDALFLPFVTSWGWATWDRAWRKFDPTAKGHAQLKADPQLRRAFDMDGAYDYFSMLEAQLEGRIDSWAIRWNLSVFMNGGMVLYPRKSLVENRGFDGSGVHCRGDSPDRPVDDRFLPAAFPAVAIDPAARNEVFGYFRAQRSLHARLRALAARILG